MPRIEATVCTIEELKAFKVRIPDAVLPFLPEYLKRFASPSLACLKCKREGTFTWGIQHGEGYCAKCHWPNRGFHYFKRDDGTEEDTFFAVLQYHPDVVIKSRRRKAA